MSFIKKTNLIFVQAFLLVVYLVGFGLTAIVRKIFVANSGEVNGFWKDDTSNLQKITKESY